MTVADFPSTQAVAYHDGQCQGKVALVLGAGNVSSLGRAYLLYKLFVENQVVLFKANPVNAHLGPRVIFHHAARKQRDSLLQRIGDVFAQVSLRSAYYPGARDRFAAFVAAHPDALLFGQPSGDKLPWTLISSVDPSKDAYIVFTTEAFCGLFAETSLAAPTVAEYIDRAVAFCNTTLWGTLNATILVHPASLKDPAVADAIDRAIANLRYGTIGVNEWPAAAYILGEMPWGGFPGSDIYDIQSGIDWVHNTLMFSRIQKSVIRARWRAMPTPPFFVSQLGKGGRVFHRLSTFEASTSPAKVPGILWAALAG